MKGWDEVALWALAETLSARIDVIRAGGGQRPAVAKQGELPLGPGGNVVDIARHRGRRAASQQEAATCEGLALQRLP
jgi:hypothetical protein